MVGLLDQVGTVEEGKIADLIVLAGNPLDHISNIRKLKMVFKDGLPVNLWALDTRSIGVAAGKNGVDMEHPELPIRCQDNPPAPDPDPVVALQLSRQGSHARVCRA